MMLFARPSAYLVLNASLVLGLSIAIPASAQTGLVAAYAFDEGAGTTVTDLSGSGNSGIIANATWTTSGKYGKALVFNGTNALVTIADSSSLHLTTAMTLEAWVNPSTISDAWRDVIYKGDSNYYLEATSTNKSRPALGGADRTTYGTAALAANVWAHLAATYDGAMLRLYVNGVEVSSQTRRATLVTSSNPLQIGGDNFYGQYFQGMIDEVRVYNTVRTAGQIQSDMAAPVAPPMSLPDLVLAKMHGSNFYQGQTGAAYTLTASNSGTAPTSGTVTVTETMPTGLTATGIGGTGWTCTQPSGPCTRSDSLNADSSYPPLTLTVNVAANAPASVTNSASVSGGGEVNSANNSVTDVTTININGLPDLFLTKTHAGNFFPGQTGATYTLTVSNVGAGPTAGTVTVTDTIPSGLTPTSVAGTGWTCTQPSGPCTRSDVLNPTSSYPSITLTVNVSASAPPSVTNTASVGGGGDANSGNNTAADPTTISSSTSGLVAAYGFDAGSGATLTDASGHGLNGTIANATWTTTGKFGKALVFNGTSSLVTITDAASLHLTTAMTLEAWVNPTTILNSWMDVIYKGNDNYYLEASSTNGSTPAVGGAGTTYGSSALAPNQWAHLAATYDGATLRLYVNGLQVSSLAHSGTLATSSNPLQIGGDSIYGQYFQGTIDEVRVYNVVLTAAQIQTDMVTPVGATSPSPDVTLQLSHAGNFFQGQSGATYTISVGNVGTQPTNGTVSVSDSVPTAETATSIAGSGWSCAQPAGPCTRSDALPAGGTYATLTLTVDVASNAPTSIINSATVSGGGDSTPGNNTANDTTMVTSATVSVSPRTAVVVPPQTQTFTATGIQGSVVWSVDGVVGGSAASGTITAAGLYTPPTSRGTHTVTASTSNQQQSAQALVYISTYAGTFTRDIDNLRTAANLQETVLTPANVNTAKFGQLFNYTLDGVADASPLYVANVSIPGQGLHNVVYVATEHDSVYAFDADGRQSSPLWRVSFINPTQQITTVPPTDTGEPSDISPEIGMTGTPVIDPVTNTLYVVAKTKQGTGGNATYVHRLHALNIATGAEKFGGPVVIQASVSGTGAGTTGSQVPFISLHENQRAALLLSNGVVYIAFASHGDNQPYHGWLLGYRASDLLRVMAFNTTPNGEGGGIWQSGDGVAADATGNLYFVTGDGTFDANTGGSDYGDSVIKLSPAGVVLDYFTPHDQDVMNSGDLDLGSGGTTLIPDQPGSHPHLALSGGKTGTIFMVDRDNLGHYRSGQDQIVQSLVNIFPGGTFTTGNFKAPVYWNGNLYFSADADNIKSFQLASLLSTAPTSQSSVVPYYPGATLGVSSNGPTNGILWAIQRVDLDPIGQSGVRGPGILHAFDATNLGVELYNSDQAPNDRDRLDYAAKWAAPLVANGKVFIATNGRLMVFGLLP
jgi:uncharacterized repeat protein (TIGR01451 family)